MDVSIVMPAYNEEANIEKTVVECMETLLAMDTEGEVLVVNDGSKDLTGEILKTLALKYSNLKVLENEENRGYGYSLNRGLKGASGKLIATIDSDGQFDISELPALISKMEDADMITGYRMRKKDTFVKVIADRIMNVIIRVLFGVSFRDTNCAFKIYRRDVIGNLNIETNGYQTPTEILLKMAASDRSIRETGIKHRAREGGSSALNPVKTGFEFLMFLIYLRLKFFLYRKKVLQDL